VVAFHGDLKGTLGRQGCGGQFRELFVEGGGGSGAVGEVAGCFSAVNRDRVLIGRKRGFDFLEINEKPTG
jgi:hypothetical protein